MPTKIETEIRGGCVEKKIGGQPYRFTQPELFARLGAGYRLLVCFDESDPAAGAEIYNLETGSRNTEKLRHMQHLGTAEWEKERPLFGYSDEVEESIARRKRHARAFHAAYAGTGIFGKRAAMAIEARDGTGNLERVEVSGCRSVGVSKCGSGTGPGAGETPAATGDEVAIKRGGVKVRNRFEMAETTV